MLRLGGAQRRVLSEKLPDLANLFAGGLVVGQFLSGEPVSIGLVLLGIAMWIGLIWAALLFAETTA
jgi:hypothetical protein